VDPVHSMAPIPTSRRDAEIMIVDILLGFVLLNAG
jgi:hypothetical protein